MNMKKRLDVLLFERELADSREKGQRLIMAGLVLVDGKKEIKAGTKFNEDVKIEVLENYPYVGRGAEKIKGAAEVFRIDFKDKVVTDIGSSTGGFTDFALQNGAKKVYAVDVGRGQLDWRLRNDSRVVVMEKTDFRKVEGFDDKIDIFVIDVSFISLRTILLKVKEVTNSYTSNTKPSIVALFKPQFEAGKEIADKCRGVIRDPEIHRDLLANFISWCGENGLKIIGQIESPIKGDDGNKEFLFNLKIC